ncbi:hypothetical protein HYX13_04510 [Candidatus Woesearchaeota archaeon]|nr:hypothetical protein [Candidatus Woesearchaeota archaeon]
MKFPYLLFEGQFLPVIPLRIKYRGEWIAIKAYIDTGASFCIFPAEMTELLGITLEEGEYKEVVLGDGDILKIYIHKITILIAGMEFEISAGFSKNVGTGFFFLF